MKYTPGPWEKIVHSTPNHVYIFPEGCFFDYEPIALIPKKTPQTMANASLIAAAPLMLSALEEFVSGFNFGDNLSDYVDEDLFYKIQYAKKVIAKAKGDGL